MTFALRPHVSATTADDGAVLLDETTGRYWQLNATAALILGALLDGAGEQRAADRLRERFPTLAADRAAHDVAALVAALTRARLVARP